MKKLILLSATIVAIFLFASSFKNVKSNKYHSKPLRTSGAAANYDGGYTGAPFDGSCITCHNNGAFAPTINVELFNAGNAAVTQYIPGASYTLRISLAASNGTPQWGFQTTSVNAGTDANLNRWGTALPTNVINTSITDGRNYIEQGARISNGIIDIPWVAPLANFGAVRFYSIGNAVNGNGGSGGDNATSTFILNIGEAVVPVRFNAFTAKKINNAATLFWQTAQEVNNDYFLVQRSITGNNFSTVGKVEGMGTTNIVSDYQFVDNSSVLGINFYRLAQTDLDGRINYSPIITYQNSKNNNSFTISPNPVSNFIQLKNIDMAGNKYIILNSVGAVVTGGILQNQKIEVANLPKGNYVLKMINQNGEVSAGNFMK